MDLISGLNESQKEAVTQTEGPVMVMAGAGSGKTKVLTTRIAYIVKELGINPYSVLAVTFTNKAANEMKERLSKMLEMDTKWMWVSTFHSFCVRVLREEIDNLAPFHKGFNIVDDDDQLKIMKELMKDSETDIKPRDLLKLISKEKNGMDVSIKSPSIKHAFTEFKSKYQIYLRDNNLFDFDDLILKTINLLKTNDSVRTKYQNKFSYILVDEFQDTNTPQYELMKILSLKTRNLFVVGDDFQSIYSFRGAKIENINRMRNDFLDTKLILLEKNYRSTTEILNLANSVIENNPNQIKKVMRSNDVSGDMPLYYNAISSYEEVSFIIENIKKLREKEKLEYKDFAVLYRANYLSREVEDAFVKAKIPYKIYGGLSFFQRMEIKDITAYLRLIINHDDNFSFRRIVNVPKRKIGEAILTKLSIAADENKLSLFDAIPYYVGSGMGYTNLNEFKAKVDSIFLEIENVKLPDLVDIIGEEMGYFSYLREQAIDHDEYEERMENLNEFKSVLKESDEFYEGDTNTEKLTKMLEDLSLRTNNDEVENDDAVRLSTYHQVKGLEFNTVFMIAMEDGIFPSINAFSDCDIEEERRICYVGITRAKRHLFLTNAKSRTRFGHQEANPKSRFIKEVDSSLYLDYRNHYMSPKRIDIKSPTPISKPSVQTESAASLFKPGDKLKHKAFGDGIVVSVAGNIITVAFKAEFGIKKLQANHPAISKL